MGQLVDPARVLKLLGTGMSSEAVATAVGCDPSYISQLMSEDTFKQQVIELRTVALTAASERDRKADSLEEKALNKLDEMISWITKPGDMLKFFQVLNAAKRRGVGASEGLVINQQIVNLQLPVMPLQKLTIDARGEVVQVGSQELITMQPTALLAKFTEQRGETSEATKALKALRNREIATTGYEKRTDASGNRASVSVPSSGSSQPAIDI